MRFTNDIVKINKLADNFRIAYKLDNDIELFGYVAGHCVTWTQQSPNHPKIEGDKVVGVFFMKDNKLSCFYEVNPNPYAFSRAVNAQIKVDLIYVQYYAFCGQDPPGLKEYARNFEAHRLDVLGDDIESKMDELSSILLTKAEYCSYISGEKSNHSWIKELPFNELIKLANATLK